MVVLCKTDTQDVLKLGMEMEDVSGEQRKTDTQDVLKRDMVVKGINATRSKTDTQDVLKHFKGVKTGYAYKVKPIHRMY